MTDSRPDRPTQRFPTTEARAATRRLDAPPPLPGDDPLPAQIAEVRATLAAERAVRSTRAEAHTARVRRTLLRYVRWALGAALFARLDPEIVPAPLMHHADWLAVRVCYDGYCYWLIPVQIIVFWGLIPIMSWRIMRAPVAQAAACPLPAPWSDYIECKYPFLRHLLLRWMADPTADVL